MNRAVPLLELRSITKRYGAVTACDAIDLEVRPGEIRGVLGQNGAGKSTLMKIAAGVVSRDAGEIVIRGRVVDIDDPLDAAAHGIAMVHQHFSLVGSLPVWKNITLGERGPVDRARSIEQVETIGAKYGLHVDPLANVEDLSIGERQRVEIVKCLRRDPDIIILDEPTSVLTIAESKVLFDILRDVIRDSGRSIVLISHRLDELIEATDEITVMRDGRLVGSVRADDATPAGLAQQMLGRQLADDADAGAVGLAPTAVKAQRVDHDRTGPARLDVQRIRHIGNGGQIVLDDCSLEVKRGEILGVAGVEGNGQEALVDLLSNLIRPTSGRIMVDGVEVQPGRGRSLLEAGVGVIPADRHDSGCVLDMSVAENLLLHRFHTVLKRGVLDTEQLFSTAAELVDEFDIRVSSLDAPLRSLSGGNQQKVVLAREVAAHPNVLVAAQPTHGLDVGAMEFMWSKLLDVAESGVAVMLVSSELDEIMALADRIAVMYRGRIIGEMPRDAVDVERLGLMMGGATNP